MLLGQVNGKTLEDLSGVTTQGTEERTVTVHHDEAELLVRFEQFTQGFCVELVVTQIKRRVDGFEGFKVDVNLPLLSFGRDDFTAVHDQSIRRDLVIELETLLGGCDGRQDRKTVDS